MSCAAARRPAITPAIGACASAVVEHVERELEVVLADGDTLFARLAEHPPRALGERLPRIRASAFGEPKRRGAADEQHAGQPSIRHGSV